MGRSYRQPPAAPSTSIVDVAGWILGRSSNAAPRLDCVVQPPQVLRARPGAAFPPGRFVVPEPGGARPLRGGRAGPPAPGNGSRLYRPGPGAGAGGGGSTACCSTSTWATWRWPHAKRLRHVDWRNRRGAGAGAGRRRRGLGRERGPPARGVRVERVRHRAAGSTSWASAWHRRRADRRRPGLRGRPGRAGPVRGRVPLQGLRCMALAGAADRVGRRARATTIRRPAPAGSTPPPSGRAGPAARTRPGCPRRWCACRRRSRCSGRRSAVPSSAVTTPSPAGSSNSVTAPISTMPINARSS